VRGGDTTAPLAISQKGDDEMGRSEFTVANQTFSLSFDGQSCSSGTLVRLEDGLEARFNDRDCLLHLLEGVVGRRVWQAHREQIEAALSDLCSCA
jgi:hypothetical protein